MAAQDLYVEEFKSRLIGGGARSNYFKATLTGLDTFGGADLITAAFLCKSASLPGSSVPSIAVPFRGREIKVSGDRKFESWNITVINDTDFQIRNAFERWLNEPINSHVQNSGDQRPASYKSQMKVEQLDKAGNSLKTYEFVGVYPVTVDPIDVSYDSSDEIESFQVTLDYDYWTSNSTDS